MRVPVAIHPLEDVSSEGQTREQVKHEGTAHVVPADRSEVYNEALLFVKVSPEEVQNGICYKDEVDSEISGHSQRAHVALSLAGHGNQECGYGSCIAKPHKYNAIPASQVQIALKQNPAVWLVALETLCGRHFGDLKVKFRNRTQQ